MKYFIITFLAIALFMVYSSCSDDENGKTPTIPNVRVNMRYDLIRYNELNSPYSSHSITEWLSLSSGKMENVGYGGILIFNGKDSVNSYFQHFKIYAFDLACPVECDKNIKVIVDEMNMIKATCPNCKAVYDLTYGKGNSENKPKYALKQYHVKEEDRYLIVITNPNYGK